MKFAKPVLSSVLLLTLAHAASVSAQTPRPRRGERPPEASTDGPTTVSLTHSASRVVLPSNCYEDEPPEPACEATGPLVQLKADATGAVGPLVYKFTTTGGEIKIDGPNARVDLTGVSPGYYTVTVEVGAGRGPVPSASTNVAVERCTCPPRPPPPCPNVDVSCPSEPSSPGQPVTFTASVNGGDPSATPTFNWTVSAGTITSGQGRPAITVDTSGVGVSFLAAGVEVGGYDRGGSTSAGCSSPRLVCIFLRKIDEYGDVRFGDEKARVDNFATEARKSVV